MWFSTVLYYALNQIQSMAKTAETRIKTWTKPATDSLIGGTAADFLKSYPCRRRHHKEMKMG